MYADVALRGADAGGGGGGGGSGEGIMRERGGVRPLLPPVHFNAELPPGASVGCAPFLMVVVVAMLPFLFGVGNVLWPAVKRWWRRRWGKPSAGETVRTITGRFHRGDARNRWSEDGGSAHSGILLHAVLLYIARGAGAAHDGESLWREADWRNKPSVLFLFDPLKSDSHLVLAPSSFEPVGVYQTGAEQRALCEREQLQRYTVLRLPTAGAWVAVGDGVYVTYQRRRADAAGVDKVEHTVHLKAVGPNGPRCLESFVSRSLRHYVKELPAATAACRYCLHMQVGKDGLCFRKTPLCSTKSFDTLFFPQKRGILALLDRFLRKEGRFAVEGIPDKLGFLLHGPEGTGKTAFAAALAAYTSRHVILLRLPLFSTNQQLLDVFLARELACVGESQPFRFSYADVVFLLDGVDHRDALLRRRRSAADGDAPALGPRRPRVNDAPSLSSLLNALDGVVETPSRIVVMTTRDPSGIDPALLRPRRFDYTVRMGHLRLPELLELLGLHYGTVEAHGTGPSTKDRRLRQEEIAEVRRSVDLLAQDEFSISGAVAESMCFAAPSLKAFLDALRRRYLSDR
ncbi:a44l protein-like protein [Trypanosoma conorhini]|uniref:A44l protein-like protein n=1 Tax=Trypanosoma conorhini TaxID=83891 RepID=A0A3R7RD67_9TRYP|nr:a44l protein-like protein [Trypanosoma conorhini]RNF00170.1 a44l protein-like protein [Trypanosoma conorhini]